MSSPADSAARPAVRDAVVATSEQPKLTDTSRPLPNSAGAGPPKPNLASSIQAFKELAAKSSTTSVAATTSGLTADPLATAYEKRIRTLQDTLKERDQVVQMLTERLEQAADQLDRVQRTGSGRGNSAVAGLPPELIENQQNLLDQLTRVLGDWETTQAGPTLARIESQIGELHDLVAFGSNAAATAPATASLSAAAAQASKISAETSVLSDIAVSEPAKAGWEAIKAAMMAGEEYDSGTATSSAAAVNRIASPAASETASHQNSTMEDRDRSSPPPTPLPEPPPAVDFDIADQSTLVEAIRHRDEFISLLLRRLSSPDANTEFPDWDKLNFVPDDLHRELLGLRDRLQEKLRVAEIDLSLQRAKLAREEAKLAIKAEHVTRQMRQLGLTPDDAGAPTSGSRALNEGSNATQGRRWLQFLQRSNAPGTDGK